MLWKLLVKRSRYWQQSKGRKKCQRNTFSLKKLVTQWIASYNVSHALIFCIDKVAIKWSKFRLAVTFQSYAFPEPNLANVSVQDKVLLSLLIFQVIAICQTGTLLQSWVIEAIPFKSTFTPYGMRIINAQVISWGFCGLYFLEFETVKGMKCAAGILQHTSSQLCDPSWPCTALAVHSPKSWCWSNTFPCSLTTV